MVPWEQEVPPPPRTWTRGQREGGRGQLWAPRTQVSSQAPPQESFNTHRDPGSGSTMPAPLASSPDSLPLSAQR